MRYEFGIDVQSLVAIDMHVHIEIDDHHHHQSLPQPLIDAASQYFKTDETRPTLDEIAQYYRERSMAAVVFTVDATTALNHDPISSFEIAEGARRNNDVLIPFGSVDPLKPKEALSKAQKLIEDAGVKGFKFHPTVQNFDPKDEKLFPVYELLQKHRVPALFHTGQTGIGAGTPGGAGMRMSLSNPLNLDDVAARFPELQVIMAHPSVPWQDEQIAIATHKANTWIDLSGWSPKYFPETLVKQANSRLQDKVLFGSDFPLLSPDKWISDFENLELKDTVRPKILKENALRLLGLH
jgi:predicted TIM-barrel fold metal-dependent hydrolase